MKSEDEELEKIKRAKLEEMMRRSAVGKKQKPALDKPVTLTDATFDESVENDSFMVVDCWAAWCAPCRMVAPIIEEMARDYAGRILFGKLNVDNNRATPTKYGIMSIPTLLYFKEGKLVEKTVGALPKKNIEEKLRKIVL